MARPKRKPISSEIQATLLIQKLMRPATDLMTYRVEQIVTHIANDYIFTRDDKIAQLEARVAELEAQLNGAPNATPSNN